MFPARAGMNRRVIITDAEQRNVPRTGGDEPAAICVSAVVYLCSPHGRG